MFGPRTLIPIAAVALGLAGCGTAGIQVSSSETEEHAGAELFAERCSGCHTLSAAGTQGSGTRSQRAQGPNFDQRDESLADVLFAIRNGGFSGAIMPQNIVVGREAREVAAFVHKYAGADVTVQPGASSP